MLFLKLGLAPSLCTPLAKMGYTQPTPVQSAAIPLVLSGVDVFARAQTGTGKTAAFALPMIDRLLLHERKTVQRGPLGLVLVPTRELAIQVHDAIAKYGVPARLRVTAIFGGVPMPAQVKALRRGADIVVATPGRLIDHLQRRTIDLSSVEILTLDEADRMLDMGFMPALRRLLPALPKSRQTLLFSATLSEAVGKLAGEFTREPRRVDVAQGNPVASTITHQILPVDLDRKRSLLLHVLTQAPAGKALVFCKTKRGADRVTEHLEHAGLKATAIHGNKSQGARSRSLSQFKDGRVRVLVATDVAARGLDVVELPLVVNYDLPLVAEDYIHRVGRTGRAGLAGRALSLVTASDRPLLRDIQKLLSTPIEQIAVTGFETTQTVTESAPRTHERRRPEHRTDPRGGSPFKRHSRPGNRGPAHHQRFEARAGR